MHIIKVKNEPELCIKWHSKTLDEISDLITTEAMELEQRYYKNVCGDFWGIIVLKIDETEYHFLQSRSITKGIYNKEYLIKCIGFYFKNEVETKSGDGLNRFYQGFVICQPNEHPKKITSVALNGRFIMDMPIELQLTLENKTVREAFDLGLIQNIEKQNEQIVFRPIIDRGLYICIDGYKVHLSNSIRSLTEEQLISMFDELVFHRGVSNIANSSYGQEWFRLGLPKGITITFEPIELLP